ncbi:conjugal transfer protein [Morganella morganii]|nr:conjugal transfer protein [Morganella morganii]
MRIKPFPMLFSLSALLLSACTAKQTPLPTEPAGSVTSLSQNAGVVTPRQTLSPDLYSSVPEVVRYDRYRLVDISPSQAQWYPLAQVVSLRIPDSVSSTVGDALRYVLGGSGYRLCTAGGQANALYSLPLPAVQNQLGPVRLSDALQVLGGPAWQVEVDEVQRVVCYSLRHGYQLPAPAVSGSVNAVVSTPSASLKPVSVSLPAPARPVIMPQKADKAEKPVHRGGWLK